VLISGVEFGAYITGRALGAGSGIILVGLFGGLVSATTTTLNGGGGGGGEWQTTYTTSRGFISDARRVLDLTVACYQAKAALSGWLLQALQMLDTERFPHTDFVQRSCRLVFSGEAAKAFWLVPFRGPGITDRTAPAGVDVIAEFA
jgi:hypothetical protein